jgi:hypothetical protein
MAVATDGAGNYLTQSDTGDWVPASISQHPETGTKLVLDGGKWVPLPGEGPSTAGAFGRGVIRGATFGFGDELEAGGRAAAQGISNLVTGGEGEPPGMGEAYDKALAIARERNAMDVQQHPIANIAGAITGGVGTTLATRGVAPRVAETVGVNPMVIANPYLRLAAGGASAGGVAGFGEGEGGVLDRLGGAGTGAALGGAVGPIAGLGVGLVNRLGGRLLHAVGLRDPEAAAERKIVQSFDRDKVPLDEVGTRLDAAGDQPVALVDVGGRNTVNLGATAANTPSRAMDVADQFVEGRRLGRPDRLTAAGDEAFGGGSGTDIPETRAALQAQRSAAGDLYERAFRIQPTTDEYGQLAPWVGDRIGQDAMQRGLRVAELEHLAAGTPFRPQDFGVTRGDGGAFVPVEGQTPNMRLLDAVKRGYDEIVEGFRDPTSGRLNLDQYGRAVDANRRAYRDTLAGMFPPYGRALQAWAGPSAQLDAIKAGESAFTTNRDIVADRMTRPPDEQSAYQMGAGRGFANRVSDPASASGQARRLLEDNQMQARLASILGPEDLATLNDTLRREVQMTAVERAVGPRAGSQTARLTAGGKDLGDDLPGPVMQGLTQVLSGHPVAGAMTAGRDILVRRLGQGINPATSDALANRLFNTDPAERAAIYGSLRNRLLTDQAAAERARRIIEPVIRGVSGQFGAVPSR